MITVLLTILKLIGIILLSLLALAFIILLLILFVPIRYRITASRKIQEENPHKALVKLSWLLHIFRLTFSYPDAAYLRMRVFFITLYRSDKPKEKKEKKKEKNQAETTKQEEKSNQSEQFIHEEQAGQPEQAASSNQQQDYDKKQKAENLYDKKETGEDKEYTPFQFFKKLWNWFKNIRYTIQTICDKIKYMIKNIKYYLQVLRSETFSNAWLVGSGQIQLLLKSIRPRKLQGNLTVGTGDPASTGQVLAIYGIIYPFLGANIVITPDFENIVLEGDILIKGRVTVYRLLKTGLIVYLNKDLRELITLFKREAA